MNTTTDAVLIESSAGPAEYGFSRREAIVDHPEYGRILIREGYGGENTLAGGQIRWRHGMAIQLQPGDTLESLRDGAWTEDASLYDAVVRGYDEARPVLEMGGRTIERMAESLGI